MKPDINTILKNYVDFYTSQNKVYGLGDKYFYGVFNNHKQVIKRLIYVVDKILPIIKKHPNLFLDKKVLDLGCGTGEHSYVLSHLCSSVDCYDPEPSHTSLLTSIFQNTNNFRILEETDCYYSFYDTVLLSGVLECVPNYTAWFNQLTKKINFEYVVLIFAPDEVRRVDGFSRHYRMYDNNEFQTTTNEDELLNSVKHLSLIDRITFNTRENRLDVIHNKTGDHKKIVHIYKNN